MDNPDFGAAITDPALREQLKELVLERIGVMPDNIELSFGSTDITKDDMLRHVENEDDVGTQMMDMELDFLRDLASGAIYLND